LKALLALPPALRIESAEAIVNGMPNPPAFEQDFQAAYIPSTDTVTMPSRAEKVHTSGTGGLAAIP